jgi:hypothetical protein
MSKPSSVKLPKLWFSEAQIAGATHQLDRHQRRDLIHQIKALELLREPRYLEDVARIIKATTPKVTWSESARSLMFVMDQFSAHTLSMLHRYVRAVYKKNSEAMQESKVNSSFYRLFDKISQEIETEASAATRNSAQSAYSQTVADSDSDPLQHR